MRWCIQRGLFIATLALATAPALADSESIGDATLIGLTAAAIGSTYLNDDAEGRVMLAKSAGAGMATIFAIKYAFNDTDFGQRPNGKGYGFPSGHAGGAAAAASFLQGRYGLKWGIPAWLATGYVSYVRVEQTHHHRWRDIAAAAVISQTSSWYFVDSYHNNKLSFSPIMDGETVGLSLAYQFE